MRDKVGYPAKTIHSTVYNVSEREQDGNKFVEFSLRAPYDETPALFVVDEASMVSNKINNSEGFQQDTSVLESIFNYCWGENTKSKILFLGDKCQLLPVGDPIASALSVDKLSDQFGAEVGVAELTEVVRQAEGSQIFETGKAIRACVLKNKSFYDPKAFNLFCHLDYSNAVERFYDLFDPNDPNKVIMITYMLRTAQFLNNSIRELIYGTPNELEVQESYILNKNYIGSGASLSKGDLIKVLEIEKVDVIADVSFAKVKIEYGDEDGSKRQTTLFVNLTLLLDEEGKMTLQQKEGVKNYRMPTIKNRVKRAMAQGWDYNFATGKRLSEKELYDRELQNDPYLNALEIRYSYVVNCHKVQGGEWDHVLVGQYAHPNSEPYRYLYTAVTRAKQTVELFKEPFVRKG